MTDTPENLTEQEIEILFKFRKRVEDVLTDPERHDNFFLCRWLRARGFDLDKAENMLRSSMAWRKKWKVDELLTTYKPPEVLVKYFPGGHCGFDKEGNPVWIEPIGRVDMKGLSLSVSKDEIIRYCIYQVERVHRLFEEQTKKTGRRISEVIFIDDLQGFGMKLLMAPGMDSLLKLVGLIESNYPECLKKSFVLHAPSIWGLIFNICKPFLHEETKKKILVMGSDWKSKLLEDIDADQLPVHWGGTQTGPDGDSYASDKIVMGGDVDEKYYLSNQQLVAPELWTETVVNAGCTLDIPLQADEPGCVINWIFKTQKHDIAYSVKYYETEETKACEELISNHRVSCQTVPEIGQVECPKVGKYVFSFSNHFSWLTGKNLGYYVHLAKPSEAEEKANQMSELMASPVDSPDQ